ncbi:hypothetical protein B0T18DRAFT_440797 [Schizothecium vesticola]|uniref:NmrA-like domain-containing protein n=1 Tax=Schizothecium vesticola TaxID=314040 RepID=A0AA40BP62_9PEZI|nr:hypothetical protein B0T18DRAFT_440797 [Schizothecium vesticola]
MVKIAIAGASSQVAQEIIDALVATGKHEIITLWRKDLPRPTPGVTPVLVDYSSPPALTAVLAGVNTVLSFVAGTAIDVQTALIDASVAAGVKRFAPSEWSAANITPIPWYSGKATIRSYLSAINTPTPKLEYTLFQPGGFLEYLAHPHQPTAHIRPLALQIDVANSRVLVAKGALDAKFTFTSVRDLARAVVAAVEYEGVWPVVGGVRGTTTTTRELVGVVERVTGRAVVVEEVDVEGEGVVGASWLPRLDHPSFDAMGEEEREKVAVGFWAVYLKSLEAGAWEVGGEWNEVLGGHSTSAETLLSSPSWCCVVGGVIDHDTSMPRTSTASTPVFS